MLDLSSPSIYIPTIFISLVAFFAAVFAKDARSKLGIRVDKLPYYDEINLSMGYLGRNILDSGRFNYRKNVDSSITYDDKIYNSLRHAGVLYSMYQYEKYGYPKAYKEERIKSSMYFIERYIEKFEDKYVVVSYPDEEQINFKIAKTGAAGVALCALANLHSEDLISIEILEGLGDFIISMQDDDGNIFAYCDLESHQINKTASALYYPAQSAAGLLALYEVDSRAKWLNSAKKTILYLAESRRALEMDVPFDHWSIMVIEKLFRRNWVSEEERRILSAYVEQMIIPTLSNQITNRNNSYFGAFKENIRPGSIGTIMEGLTASYFCLDSEDLKTLVYKALSIGCLFLSRVQVKTGEQAGGLPNSANWVRPGVTPNASVIRMDNIQHVVLGWLKFQTIINIEQSQQV